MVVKELIIKNFTTIVNSPTNSAHAAPAGAFLSSCSCSYWLPVFFFKQEMTAPKSVVQRPDL